MRKKVAERLLRLREARPYLRPIPHEQRKQIYLPDFVITLIRTPFLPPRYASFWVPLTFNKLDIKDYLKQAYGVDVLKVRSYVEQQRITREKPCGKEGYGKWRRPMARKKMTVEMTEPFVWPEEPEDYKPWEKDRYFEAKKLQEDASESIAPDAKNKPMPQKRRDTIAEQAKRLLEGKEEWQPTWKALGLNYDRPVLGTGVNGAKMAPAEILKGENNTGPVAERK
ncbi:mitochondrial 54S ribosomal protein YmL41 [Histoplasma capsulatum var. duboisii H88]|uniref:Large ribosomal subunit protein uL23m n=1 Tax=Ajellomyces capsulatus (strain H88) TaxID=544711 RepID=A0A8A1LN23_AJEC8|nr:mitochondrial 54S ribosomal protein YmL41 [Histoplasma capsulatum var. duboisii H88]